MVEEICSSHYRDREALAYCPNMQPTSSQSTSRRMVVVVVPISPVQRGCAVGVRLRGYNSSPTFP